MLERFETEKIYPIVSSTEQARRSALELGKDIKSLNCANQYTNVNHHELRHAAADIQLGNPGGYFILFFNGITHLFSGAGYVHEGKRTPLHRLIIAMAPGKDMSQGDWVNVLSISNFIRLILGNRPY